MHTVILRLPQRAISLSAQMTNMRAWLDAHRFTPSRFHCNLQPQTVTIEAEFSDEREAEAFKRHFAGPNGDGDRGRSKKPQRRETMEQVCWWRLTAEELRAEAEEFASKSARETMALVAQSYDRLAEDLEKRLVNPRYRNGLFIG
jgi:hypothetical protein